MIDARIKNIKNRLNELCKSTCLWEKGLRLHMKTDDNEIVVYPCVYATCGSEDTLIETWRLGYENEYMPYPGQNTKPVCWDEITYVRCLTTNGSTIFDGTPDDFVRKMALYENIIEFWEDSLQENCYDYKISKEKLKDARHAVSEPLLVGAIVQYRLRAPFHVAGCETTLTQTGRAIVINVEPHDVTLLDTTTGKTLFYDPADTSVDIMIQ